MGRGVMIWENGRIACTKDNTFFFVQIKESQLYLMTYSNLFVFLLVCLSIYGVYQ